MSKFIKNNIHKFGILFIFLSITIALVFGPKLAIADNIQRDFCGEPILGEALETPSDPGYDFNKINDDIYNNKSTQQHSLYDRFGPNVHYTYYKGEAAYMDGVADKLYTQVIKQAKQINIIDLIKDVFDKTQPDYSTTYYEGRLPVLTDARLKSGAKDTRASSYQCFTTNGYTVGVANQQLDLANFIIRIINFFLSGINNTINKLAGDVTKEVDQNSPIYKYGISPFNLLILSILPIAMAITVFRIVGYIYKYLKEGSGGLRNIIWSSVIVFLASAILMTGTALPSFFMRFANIGLSVANDTIASSLNQTEGNKDNVCHSDDMSNIASCTLWRNSIFNNWVNAYFNGGYDKAYTQYSNVDANDKLPQDNDDTSKHSGYNSAKITGDISVPLGKGVEEKNWAALLYSTQSIDHMPALVTDREKNKDKIGNIDLYNKYGAEKMPRNANEYTDEYRIIDASMNIGSRYKNGNAVGKSYPHSRAIRQKIDTASSDTLIIVMFLLPLGFIIIRRVLYYIRSLFYGIILIWNSFLTIMDPMGGYITSSAKKWGKDILSYIIETVKIGLLLTIYSTGMGSGAVNPFGFPLIFCILCLVLCAPPLSQMTTVAGGMSNILHNIGIGHGKHRKKNKTTTDKLSKYKDKEDKKGKLEVESIKEPDSPDKNREIKEKENKENKKDNNEDKEQEDNENKDDIQRIPETPEGGAIADEDKDSDNSDSDDSDYPDSDSDDSANNDEEKEPEQIDENDEIQIVDDESKESQDKDPENNNRIQKIDDEDVLTNENKEDIEIYKEDEDRKEKVQNNN